LWTASPGGVVVYQTLQNEHDVGWVATDLSGAVQAASPVMTGHCLPPAYSCMMEFALFVDA